MFSFQVAALLLAASGGSETVLLDFHADWCGPCRNMEPAVSQLIGAGYPIRKVNVDRERELAARYHVSSIPCYVLLVDGKEVDRLVGASGAGELQAMFAKARLEQTQAKGPRTQSPDPPLPSAGAMPNGGWPACNLNPPQSPAAPGSQAAGLPAANSAAPGAGLSAAQLLAASVRLTIVDRDGESHGSGTIIDSRQGEALVLTCGHIFRDSQGKGKILVDVFGPNPAQKVPGRLISYDIKRDVGLISIRPGAPVSVAHVAPAGNRLAAGDKVISVGFDHGADASVRESKVNGLNKFLGPANVQVAGLPVQGRSGGGLFDMQGNVVGVCNAADPADNEGLFAAAATIQEELDRAGLAALYQAAGAEKGMAAAGPAAGGAQPAGGALKQLTPAETATLAALGSKVQGAEVICIVRSLTDPQAKSEIIVLDRASPAFMERLSAEQGNQGARHLTSLDVSRRSAPQPANTGAGVPAAK